MQIYAVDHIQLAMPQGEEAQAVAFYEGVLGLRQVAKPPHLERRGGCWFHNGSVKVHLGVDPQFRSATKAHPALLVDDLSALRVILSAAGIPSQPDEPLEGYDRLYIQDPFGNRIEVMEKLAA